MPNAPETKRRDNAGTSKTVDIEQIIDLFGFIGVHELAPAMDGLLSRPGQRGRPSPYPAAALLATLAAARAAGSQAEALKILRIPEVWEKCREQYRIRSKGVVLPPCAPGRDQVRYVRRLFAQEVVYIERLQRRFQHLALGQARQLGNLRPGSSPKGTEPDERNSIYSDGTIITPYSDVRVVTDPVTGELRPVGSRAKSVESARIQGVLSNTALDGKTDRGLNMVAVSTWTCAGRVVLGTATALGAEQWAVLDLVDSLHANLEERDQGAAEHGGAIHTLINDRAITGWSVDYLMGALGIQVLSKAVGRTTDKANQYRFDEQRPVSRLAAEVGVDPTGPARKFLRYNVLSDMVRYHQYLPVGLSIYPTSGRDFEPVHSQTAEVDPASHVVDEQDCQHRLIVDDGALFMVEDHPEEGYPVKSWLLSCKSSTRYRRPDGRWGTRNSYNVPCRHGDFRYTRTWEPCGTRYTADSHEKNRAPKDTVGWQLRPLNRADDIEEFINHGVDTHKITRKRFSESFGRRNDAESYNRWVKNGLPNARASSDVIACQELDFLLAAVLNNSLTWRNHTR